MRFHRNYDSFQYHNYWRFRIQHLREHDFTDH